MRCAECIDSTMEFFFCISVITFCSSEKLQFLFISVISCGKFNLKYYNNIFILTIETMNLTSYQGNQNFICQLFNLKTNSFDF